MNGRNITLEEFKNLIKRSTIETVDGLQALNSEEMAFVNNIRNSIPMPNSNTILQKVLPVDKKDAFFKADGNPKKIGGYMTTAVDSKELNTYQKIYDGMRLDYKNSDFKGNECIIIRFKSKDVGNLNIPRNKNNGGVLNDPLISDPYNKNEMPFTGNGFTAGKNGTLGVPELKADYNMDLKIDDGAEMYLQIGNNEEIYLGTYDMNLKVFIKKL
ncbi:MAG: hypothetical protein ACK50A_17030 [Sphingobacteriaceae bacterium]